MWPQIHKTVNEAWKKGRTQEEWEKSILVILYTKGSALECSNYRTIAIISHLSKILNLLMFCWVKGSEETEKHYVRRTARVLERQKHDAAYTFRFWAGDK